MSYLLCVRLKKRFFQILFFLKVFDVIHIFHLLSEKNDGTNMRRENRNCQKGFFLPVFAAGKFRHNTTFDRWLYISVLSLTLS